MRAVLVTGGRDFDNKDAVFAALDEWEPDIVIHGKCATGADYWAQKWADQQELPFAAFPAKWTRLKKPAGPIRNSEMVRFAAVLERADVEVIVLAFPGETGTEDCVTKATRANLQVQRCNEEGEC